MNDRAAIRQQFDDTTRALRTASFPGKHVMGPKLPSEKQSTRFTWRTFYESFEVGQVKSLNRHPGSQMNYWANQLRRMYRSWQGSDGIYFVERLK